MEAPQDLATPTEGGFVFIGDSITDSGRLDDSEGLGFGFVRMLSQGTLRHSPLTIVNSGVSGNRVEDLATRWEADVMAHRPSVLTVMIGVNETLRRFDRDDVTELPAFDDRLRQLVRSVQDQFGTRVIIFEPFLVPITEEQWTWREDLDPRIRRVRRIAEDLGARLVGSDSMMAEAASWHSAADVIPDGIHPSDLGHELLARAWSNALSTIDGLGGGERGC